ncbi:MAG: head GIN domain-containing protein [Ginsengibacter sp.]
MKFLFLTMILMVGSFANAQQKIISDPNAEIRDVEAFSGIKVSGGIDVYLSQSDGYALAVSASEAKYRDNIRTEVKNGVLLIGYDAGSSKWLRGDKKLRVYISFHSINSIEASGACGIKIDETLQSSSLLLKLSGACDIEGEIKVEDMIMDLSGASTVKLNGAIGNLKVSSSGASDIKSYDLVVDNLIANISGASDVKVTINNSLSAKASGASSLRYRGNPAKQDVAVSGASSVSQRNN